MSKPAAIFLCDLNGVAAKPWARAGYVCYCVDIQHSIRRDLVKGNIHYAWGDVRSWRRPAGLDIRFILATPPCTHMAVSGARDFIKKGLPLLADAFNLFNACEQIASWADAPYGIENPVGVLSTHHRKPDHIFHPWEYAGYLTDPQADNTSKKTCLWTGNGFIMPEKRPALAPHREDCWLASPSDDRADVRSQTPAGFAEALFLANDHRPVGLERVA